MSSKLEELLSAAKLDDIIRSLKKPEPVEEKKKNPLRWVLAIIGAVAAVAAIAYAVYRFVTPDYLDDFDDDFDDDFEEEETEEETCCKSEESADECCCKAEEPAADTAEA